MNDDVNKPTNDEEKELLSRVEKKEKEKNELNKNEEVEITVSSEKPSEEAEREEIKKETEFVASRPFFKKKGADWKLAALVAGSLFTGAFLQQGISHFTAPDHSPREMNMSGHQFNHGFDGGSKDNMKHHKQKH